MAKADQGKNQRDKGQSMIDLYKMKIANEKAELVYAVLEEIEKVLVLTRSFTEKMGDVSKIEAVYENLETIDKVVANLSDIQKIDGFKSEVEKLVSVITPLKTELLTLKDSMVSAKDTTITAKDSIMGVQAKVEAIKTELSGYNENFTNSLNAAKLSEQNAKQSEVNAKQSEANAKQSEINAKAVQSKADEAIATAQTIQTLASGVTQSATKATQAATNAKASEQIAYTSQNNVQSIEARMEAKFATMTSGKKTAVFLHKGEYDTSKYVELPFDFGTTPKEVGSQPIMWIKELGTYENEKLLWGAAEIYKLNVNNQLESFIGIRSGSTTYNVVAMGVDKIYKFAGAQYSGNTWYYDKSIYEIDIATKQTTIIQSNVDWLGANGIQGGVMVGDEIFFWISESFTKYNVKTKIKTSLSVMKGILNSQSKIFIYKNKIYLYATYTERINGSSVTQLKTYIYDIATDIYETKDDLYQIGNGYITQLGLSGKFVIALGVNKKVGTRYELQNDFIFDLETETKTLLATKTNGAGSISTTMDGKIYYSQTQGSNQYRQSIINPSMTGVKALAELP